MRSAETRSCQSPGKINRLPYVCMYGRVRDSTDWLRNVWGSIRAGKLWCKLKQVAQWLIIFCELKKAGCRLKQIMGYRKMAMTENDPHVTVDRFGV